jgi:hypothetical protein
MSDDKTKQDKRDDSQIDANDPSEVEYAAKKFGVTPAKVRETIAKVGNSRAKVEEALKG